MLLKNPDEVELLDDIFEMEAGVSVTPL